MSQGPRVLITNDDGIGSPGLHALAAAAVRAGLSVVVAAPASEASGSSSSITAVEEDGRISIEERHLEGLDGVEAFAVHGAPAFISMIATHGAFGDPPDLVLSGVNRGANVGRAILHSGTVGAALTAGVNDGRGMAVSLDTGLNPVSLYWDQAARLAVGLLPFLMDLDVGSVLNLNVPNHAGDSLPELRTATLTRFGIVQTTLAERGQQHVRLAIADTTEDPDPDSDAALLAAGFATVTAIQPVTGTALPALPAVLHNMSPGQRA
ncbi:5'/3'-nucleotidase SurE [Pseudarthrobacter sp. J75]|uniref:5'/3'-nucleotidase SurE n=1 Tax=unclassified Pseudarthrobacter TaxID=2647000 RepID=UPI002E8032DF|nr:MULTISPECIES: 5'/3'-nucleotidase SurE [unclassified Pseudarthrobacter]MEE2523790.1 5'/3'-nucleotidase SurE [Pseudarthrobacter sp. J47]MEE2529956.1 5'/3'-nucleotidase SurE [Pseudarthrobacter sp. J75]